MPSLSTLTQGIIWGNRRGKNHCSHLRRVKAELPSKSFTSVVSRDRRFFPLQCSTGIHYYWLQRSGEMVIWSSLWAAINRAASLFHFYEKASNSLAGVMEATGSILHLFLRTLATFFSSLIFRAIHACFTRLQPPFSVRMGACICRCHQRHTQRWNCNSQPADWVSVWHWGTGWCEDVVPRAPVAQPWNLPQCPSPTTGMALFYSLRQSPEHFKSCQKVCC